MIGTEKIITKKMFNSNINKFSNNKRANEKTILDSLKKIEQPDASKIFFNQL